MRIIAVALLGVGLLTGSVAAVPVHASAYPCTHFDRFSGKWRPPGCTPWE
ncbi:hypothetical protein [Actinomadura oligospora]|nr:hypothetical protein [Actinomadura oligospora]